MLLDVCPQRCEVPRSRVGAALDLDRYFSPSADDEVAFESRLGAPEVNRDVALVVGAVREQLHQHEVLQRAPEVLTRGAFDAAAGQVAGHADVEQIELRGTGDHGAGAPAAERLHEDAQQRVDENLEVLAHRLGVDPAIPRDVAVVHQLAVTVGQGVEEPRERGDVAGQPLVEHLLLQVVVDVAGEGTPILSRVVVLGHQSPVQRPQQVELRDLRPRQGMEGKAPRAAAQQVRAPALQLPGARSTQHEADALVLDHAVHLVEQGRHALHLVDDHGSGAGGVVQRQHALRQRPGCPRQLQHQSRVQEVEADGSGKPHTQQGRLAGLAGAPQERRLSRGKIDAKGARIELHCAVQSELV